MAAEPFIFLFGNCVLRVVFGVRAHYTKIPILNAVTYFVLREASLANSLAGG